MRTWITRSGWSLSIVLVFVWSANDRMHGLRFWEQERTLNYDIATYYHYLPASIIHGDPWNMNPVRTIQHSGNRNGKGIIEHGIARSPGTGHDVLKVTCGVALLELPAFLVAHTYCLLGATGHAADGYSAPYQLAVSISAYAFVALGLLWLAVFIRRYLSDAASAFALIVIGFGTNLYFYSTVDAGMSHGYLFFLFAGILERTDAWHRAPRPSTAAMLGLLCGLSMLIRPVDALIALVPIFWNFIHGWREKWASVRVHRSHVALAFVLASVPWLPQLFYWKVATGHFVFDPYPGEGFNWSQPHVIEGLFGFRKGWLVYSPLVAIGLLALAVMALKEAWAWYTRLVFLFLIPFIYVVFCWTQWWYGGGFGARPLVEATALLALPTAWVFETLRKRSRLMTFALSTIVLACIHLNLFQHRQYVSGVLRWDEMNQERYWEILGKKDHSGLREFPYGSEEQP